MNTITIELCAEDRARLDAILEALRGPRCAAEGSQAKAEPEHPVADPFPEEPPKEEAPKKPEPPKVKMEDVQQKVVELSAAGKKAEVRAIVTAYAERVSNIPEAKLGEVMEKLLKLEG